MPSSFETTLEGYSHEYQPGAIRQIWLRHFQIAEYAEYKFVPSFNLIIGANGAGKSTIVAAIYLIFGGKLHDIGRAHYNEFIQSGREKAVVNVQIQGKGTDSIEIEMQIHKNKRTPIYYVNGEQCSQAEVSNLTCNYNIQVNNLCQFLPQNRVAAFSAESPSERLRTTEQSEGNGELLRMHEELAKYQDTLCEVRQEYSENSKSLVSLQVERSTCEKTLQQLEKMRECSVEIQRLERLIPLVKYAGATKKKKELELQINVLEKKISGQTSNEKLAMALKWLDKSKQALTIENTQLAKLSSEKLHLEKSLQLNSSNAHMSTTALKSDFDFICQFDDKINEINEKIDYDMRCISHTEKKLSNFLSDADLDNQIENIRHNADQLNEEIMNLMQQQDECKQELEELRAKTLQSERRLSELDKNLDDSQHTISRRLKKLSSVLTSQEVENLKQAISFLEHHLNEFEKPVLLPGLISVSIKDPQFLPQISGAVSLDHFKKFVCQTPKDYRTFAILTEKQNVVANAIDLSSSSKRKREDHKTAQPWNVLKLLGFDGVVIDLLDGPPEILNMLCHFKYANIPFSKTHLPVDSVNLIRKHGYTGTYVDATTKYTCSRSKFGRRNVLLGSSTIRTENWLLTISEDAVEEKEEINLKIKELKSSIEKNNRKIADLNTTYNNLKIKLESPSESRRKLINELETVKQQKQERLQLVSSVHRLKKEVEQLKQEHAQLSNTLGLKHRHVLHSMTDMQMIEDLVEPINGVYEKEVLSFSSSLNLINLTENINILNCLVEESVSETRRQLERSRKALADFQVSMSVLADAVRSVKRTISAEEYRDLVNQSHLVTEDLVCQQLSDARRLVQQNDNGEDYDSTKKRRDKLAQLIARMEESIAQNRTQENFLEQSIKETFERWDSRLTSLVEQISHRFQELFSILGCEGKVCLNRREMDFKSWGIDVLVSFRDETPLQALMSKRQSGGERAVVTATYLMALQAVLRPPFCVLDEINQGMDEFNETAIHKLLVHSACNGLTCQTILVTPKLLPNLSYHKNLQALVLISGQEVEPESILSDEPSSFQALKILSEKLSLPPSVLRDLTKRCA